MNKIHHLIFIPSTSASSKDFISLCFYFKKFPRYRKVERNWDKHQYTLPLDSSVVNFLPQLLLPPSLSPQNIHTHF